MNSITHTNTIADEIKGSEEMIPISPTDTEGLQPPPDSITGGTSEPCIDWNTEDTDIGEPPTYMLAGVEVGDDDGWQISGEHTPPLCPSHAQPRSQSTAATVVPATATALGLTLFRYTKPPLSRPSLHSARRIGRGRVEWASQDPWICLLGPVCVPSATWFQRDLGRLLGLTHHLSVVMIQRAAIGLRRLPHPRTATA